MLKLPWHLALGFALYALCCKPSFCRVKIIFLGAESPLVRFTTSSMQDTIKDLKKLGVTQVQGLIRKSDRKPRPFPTIGDYIHGNIFNMNEKN